MLKPVQLLTLTVVVRTGSFTEAGRELGYTPSAVAQQVAALERTLGVHLVERGPQRIRPTSAAYLLADRSLHILEVLTALEEEARAVARGQRGRLCIGTALDPGEHLFATSLSQLESAGDGLEIYVEDARSETLIERVVAGSVDIGLVYDYPAAPLPFPSELGTVALGVQPWLLVLPSRWRRDHSLGELADREWVVGLDGEHGVQALGLVCAAAGFQPRIRIVTANRDVVVGLVAAEAGVGIVPTLPWERMPGVRLQPVQEEGATRCIFAVHRRGSTNPIVHSALRTLRRVATLRRVVTP